MTEIAVKRYWAGGLYAVGKDMEVEGPAYGSGPVVLATDYDALLAAAERMADAIARQVTQHGDGYEPTARELAMSDALARFRSTQPEQQHKEQGNE